ncbi:hypothetical protein [Methylobacterium goesingense]|uniref:Uncharacterized protein n=1 Tax=Methylobacterium goesingense TaxID=243690 RepID=A0ABV2L0Z0_9HYPH|nr:hypothetical protein [Methylobacterium goesingense]GJD72183.1 hypothetical protein CFIICLFH_0396 [Methylobacterium goesingense]
MSDKILASSAETSPEVLLKQAILGARASAEKADKPSAPVGRSLRFKAHPALISTVAIAFGAMLGAGAMGLAASGTSGQTETVGQLRLQLDAMRAESGRQAERLTKSLAQLQDITDAARSEAKTRSATLSERLGRAEQSLSAKITATGDRLEQAEKDQTARLAALTTQIEKRAAAPTPTPVAAPQAAKSTPPEPTETGSLADKPKAAPTENWAVREVYDGVAVLEDRKRRLVEVGQGDTVPGLGRVEAIERRGKAWVVVTKQGLITPQAW